MENTGRLAKLKKRKQKRSTVLIYIALVAAGFLCVLLYMVNMWAEAERQAASAMLIIPESVIRPAIITEEDLAEVLAQAVAAALAAEAEAAAAAAAAEEAAAAATEEPPVEEEPTDEAPPDEEASSDAASGAPSVRRASVQPIDHMPYDRLFVTSERRAYRDNDLTLIIPKIDRVLPIYNGVTEEVLRRGVGLYDYAQLPGEGNRNVSLAGHRNTSRLGVITDNAPFYYVDLLTQGDYLYLTHKDRIYRYLYEDTRVVDAYDWSPVFGQGFSSVTITSCTPIGIGSHRIVVRGRLDEIFPLSDDFEYHADRGARMRAEN